MWIVTHPEPNLKIYRDVRFNDLSVGDYFLLKNTKYEKAGNKWAFKLDEDNKRERFESRGSYILPLINSNPYVKKEYEITSKSNTYNKICQNNWCDENMIVLTCLCEK